MTVCIGQGRHITYTYRGAMATPKDPGAPAIAVQGVDDFKLKEANPSARSVGMFGKAGRPGHLQGYRSEGLGSHCRGRSQRQRPLINGSSTLPIDSGGRINRLITTRTPREAHCLGSCVRMLRYLASRRLSAGLGAVWLAASLSAVEARVPFPQKSDAEPHHGVRDAKMKTIQGIDVSRWQQEIDWQRVARAGTRFAFIKATEGGDHLDPKFRENWREAKAAGIPRGAYHFVFWCRPARDQIRWFFQNVPREAGALPPVLDVEWNNHSRCPRTTPERARAKMREMLAAFERHYGKKPIIYTDINFHADVLEGTTEFDDYPFWIRSTARPEKRYENRPWEFWQFTTTGRVPGIVGDVDRNAFFGTEQQFRDWKAGRYCIGSRRPLNASSRVARTEPAIDRPTPEARAAATARMNQRPPARASLRTPSFTGSVARGD